MNINNAKAVVTTAPKSIAQTASHLLFDCAGITNSAETSSTIARIGCAAVVGTTLGATVIGPGLLGAVSAKTTGVFAAYTCQNMLVGAISGAAGFGMAEGCEIAIECQDEMSQDAEPVTTQPKKEMIKTRKSMDSRAHYHSIATSDSLPLLSEDSSDESDDKLLAA